MGHIFISYSHKDKDYVHKLQTTLETEGFSVWIDDRIHYGSEWPRVVEKKLDSSGVVIVVLSNNSHESEMVQNEVARAREKKIPIFPLLLDGENWLITQAKQYVDVRGETLPDEKFYQSLAQKTPRNKHSIPLTIPPERKKFWIRPIIVGSIGIFSVVIFIVLWNIFNLGSAAGSTATPTTQFPTPSETQAFMIEPSLTSTVESTVTSSSTPTFTPVIPSEMPTLSPTVPPSLTFTPTGTITSAENSCIQDIKFYVVVRINGKLMLSFDTPFTISYPNMDNNRNVNFGDDLSFRASSTEYFNLRAGLYDTSKPNRLYIMVDLPEGLNIQILLKQEGVWHCTGIFAIPHIPPPPTAKPIIHVKG